MNIETWTAFRPDSTAVFVDRPNRFVVRAEIGGEVVEVHCPNPGRISELLFPGSKLILERAPAGRKLSWTLVAVDRIRTDGTIDTVPLVSVRANAAVGALVLPRLFPGAGLVKPEHSLGKSRFDWYVEDAAGVRHLVEVKACSEVECGTALFPDAPSLRARKHLEELAAWGAKGYVPHVIFAVVHGDPRSFGPNVHTDPDFARTLVSLAPELNLRAVGFRTGPDGTTRMTAPDIPIDLRPAGPDSGHLVRILETEGKWTVGVEWFQDGFGKAVSKAPARRSFAIRGTPDRSLEYQNILQKAAGSGDPLANRVFINLIMGWRHQTSH